MNDRTRSIGEAIAAGVLIGSTALVVRFWPVSQELSVQVSPPPTAVPSASSLVEMPLELSDAGPDAAVSSEPVSNVRRFDLDPIAMAACPGDMAFVEGMFCPKLAYTCARVTGSIGYRCAEYARGNRCMEEPDYRRFCIDRHEWPNRAGENPKVYVDWYEAKELCASAGKRLCRRSEWTLACEGPKWLPYPWGFVRSPSPCNIDRKTVPFDVSAMMSEASREEELARLWQADRIGTHPHCVSAFGAYDMSGNVDEWTDNQADDPETDQPSTLNGGYWGPVRNTCRLTTKTHGPTFKFYQVGFRCCADTKDGVKVPEPRPFIERKEREEKEAD